MATFLIARQILALPLPELKVAEQHTTSSALHDINFVGQLRRWDNFVSDVRSNLLCHQFRTFPLIGMPNHANLIDTDYFSVADEHGIQGRFAERIGQALGAISADEGTGIYFADARAAPLQSTGIPDMVVMNQRSLT